MQTYIILHRKWCFLPWKKIANFCTHANHCIATTMSAKNIVRMFLGWHCRHSGLVVSGIDSGSNGLVSNPCLGHCVVFLGKTLHSQIASLLPEVKIGSSKFSAWVTLRWTSNPIRGRRNTTHKPSTSCADFTLPFLADRFCEKLKEHNYCGGYFL